MILSQLFLFDSFFLSFATKGILAQSLLWSESHSISLQKKGMMSESAIEKGCSVHYDMGSNPRQTSCDCLLVLVNFNKVQVPNILNNEKAKK